MPGGNVGAAQLQRLVQHDTEFQMPVALNAGIGGDTAFVAADKVTDDPAVELLLKIQQVEGDVHFPGHGLRIPAVVIAAAGCTVKTHGAADTAVALLSQQKRSHTAVHAAAQSDEYIAVIHGHPSFLSQYISAGEDCQFGRGWKQL